MKREREQPPNPPKSELTKKRDSYESIKRDSWCGW